MRRGAAAFLGRVPLTGWVSDLPLRAVPPADPAPIPATRLSSCIPGRAANSCIPARSSTFLPLARFGFEARACHPSPPHAVAGSQLLPRGEGNSSRPPPLPRLGASAQGVRMQAMGDRCPLRPSGLQLAWPTASLASCLPSRPAAFATAASPFLRGFCPPPFFFCHFYTSRPQERGIMAG